MAAGSQWAEAAGNRDERRGSSLTLSYSQYQSLESTGCVRMLEKSDVILKHPSPFSIESLLGKTGEEGPCVSVSPPALQTPFLFPQLVPHTQVRPLPLTTPTSIQTSSVPKTSPSTSWPEASTRI